jgi:hypothetical protein
MRARLERHAHSLLVSDRDAEPDTRTTEIYRKVRAGLIKDVKILHLIGKDDNGTPSEPFKTLKGNPATARQHLQTAIARLSQLVTFLRPKDAPTAIPFFNALQDKLLKYADKNVTWDELGKYYSAIMRRVSSSASAFQLGSSSNALAVFNIEWLKARNDEQETLEDAVHTAMAENVTKRGAPSGNSPSGSKVAKTKSTKQLENERKQKEESKAKRVAKAKDRDDGKGDVERASGVQPGKATPRPTKEEKAAWDAFKADHEWGPPRHGRNPDKKVPPCFDFHNPQGCVHKDKCNFCHLK